MTVFDDTERTAAEHVYASAHSASRELLTRISELLVDMPLDGILWDRVETVVGVNARLADAICLLRNSTDGGA